jgi:hypothetical protein
MHTPGPGQYRAFREGVHLKKIHTTSLKRQNKSIYSSKNERAVIVEDTGP